MQPPAPSGKSAAERSPEADPRPLDQIVEVCWSCLLDRVREAQEGGPAALRRELVAVDGYAARENDVLAGLVDRASDARADDSFERRAIADSAFVLAAALYHEVTIMPLVERAIANGLYDDVTPTHKAAIRRRRERLEAPQPGWLQ